MFRNNTTCEDHTQKTENTLSEYILLVACQLKEGCYRHLYVKGASSNKLI